MTPDHPPALSPDDSAKRFKVPDDLSISLVVAEPDVSQPLSISFDGRGRMWVLQYLQYPNPNGLKAVEMDNWLRTKYDKIPDPPPTGPKGKDRISIYEDRDGDGRAEVVKPFISDLNLASGMALGYSGVFVVQSPYLLFYADKDQNDVPDGPPEVLLKGFGMEDAHAFANSLTWGPDGWLYGCQGSTATANIRGIGFQQGVWRYHPRTREFELFSEGGGNAWGVEFDRFGNVFSAGNEVEPVVHHVQGAYYVKGFGKHGPLHNPHAYGYFQPVLHHGYVGDSLTGGAILYQGGAFPSRFNNACIAPNTRHSASRWSTVETRGSTFATRAAGDFITTDDIWFRPIESTVGPDGALYVADWYDYNISHSSPKNRSEWYQPSRFDGRVWRVAPPDLARVPAGSLDLSRKSSADLIPLLSHPNDWYAREARRIFAERRDPSVIPALTKLALESSDQRLALQGLWSIYVSGGLDEQLALQTLASPYEYVRAWTIRLLGDARQISSPLRDAFVHLAREDQSVIVRSQLACTAKRLPATAAIAIVEQLLRHDADLDDPHVPLLLWWAIEDKAISDTPTVLRLVESAENWPRPLMQRIILERLARRFAAEGTDASFAACAKLFQLARTDVDLDLLLTGTLQALSGRKLDTVPPAFESSLKTWLAKPDANPRVIELALRMSVPQAADLALRVIANPQAAAETRVAIIKTLGETRTPAALDGLLALLRQPEPLPAAALAALGYFNEDRIADVVLENYPQLTGGSQSRAVELLSSRRTWAFKLLAAVEAQTVKPEAVPLEQVRRLRELDDEPLTKLIVKHWGRIQTTTPLEKQGRIFAVSIILARGSGDAARGREHFQKVCANCHKLHGTGNIIGPDLTGAERQNRELLIRNIVDPNSMIREQYLSHVATTTDGRILTGLLAESNADTITLLDAQNKRTVLNRGDLDELQETKASLMPEKLLDTLTDQQLRDLFAHIQSEAAKPAQEPAKPAWRYAPELLRPFWQGSVMEGESVLFIQDPKTGDAKASVLFPVKQVLAVRNSAGDITYENGRDYVWKPESREIVLPAGSRIVSRVPSDLRRPAKSQKYQLTHRDGNGEIFFGGRLEYAEMQTCITYSHAPDLWKSAVPKFDAKVLPRSVHKLLNKQPLSMVVLGDSISAGANASAVSDGAPYQPAYPELLQRHLAARYQGKVALQNLSVGGTDTGWALTMIDKVVEPQPDLVIVAFGMNDSSGRAAKDYQANIESFMAKIRERLPDVEFILVASMLGNRDWITLKHEFFPQYRDALASLCQPGVALADLTSVWTGFLELKLDWDHSGNGVNHPNDFGHRVYAQVLATLLVPAGEPAADPEPEKTVEAGPLRLLERRLLGNYTYSYACAAADLDGDGDLDLTSSDAEPNSNLYLLRNDGKGNFGHSFVQKYASEDDQPIRLEPQYSKGDAGRTLVLECVFGAVCPE